MTLAQEAEIKLKMYDSLNGDWASSAFRSGGSTRAKLSTQKHTKHKSDSRCDSSQT